MNIKKHSVSRTGLLSRKNRIQIFLRWFCCIVLLLLFYMLMCSGVFKTAQPLLIIPFALAVAMRSGEAGSSLFGMFCGLMIDLASGNLLGMSAVWLMPCCLMTSLLVTHLIRVNFINHLWISAVTCLIMAFMEYFFKYFIWDSNDYGIVLINYILPSYLSAVIISPLIYFIVKTVYNKFTEKEKIEIEEKLSGDEERVKN